MDSIDELPKSEPLLEEKPEPVSDPNLLINVDGEVSVFTPVDQDDVLIAPDTPVNRITYLEYIVLTIKFDPWIIKYNGLTREEIKILVNAECSFGVILRYIRGIIKTTRFTGLYLYYRNTLIAPNKLACEICGLYGVVNRLTITLAAENVFG